MSKIHTHLKLAFVIGLLAAAHLQMKHAGSTTFLDPEIVAGIVLFVMGSLAFGAPKDKKKEKELIFLKNDDYDMSA